MSPEVVIHATDKTTWGDILVKIFGSVPNIERYSKMEFMSERINTSFILKGNDIDPKLIEIRNWENYLSVTAGGIFSFLSTIRGEIYIPYPSLDDQPEELKDKCAKLAEQLGIPLDQAWRAINRWAQLQNYPLFLERAADFLLRLKRPVVPT